MAKLTPVETFSPYAAVETYHNRRQGIRKHLSHSPHPHRQPRFKPEESEDTGLQDLIGRPSSPVSMP